MTAFIRTADDIADHPTLRAGEKLAYLDLLEAELQNAANRNAASVRFQGRTAVRHWASVERISGPPNFHKCKWEIFTLIP